MSIGAARFITFDGPDGAGKSTQLHAVAELLRGAGLSVLECREPGGTRVGEAIRSIVLDPANDMLDARAELLLYEASRVQVVEEVIRPALEVGTTVLCDRFWDSTTAYQGYGRGLDLDLIDQLNRFATAGLVPDRTIFLELDTEIGLARARGLTTDRLQDQGIGFHEATHGGFSAIAAADPQRIRVVQTSSSFVATTLAVIRELADLFPGVHLEEGSIRDLLISDGARYYGGLA